jgi:hypothetical protein
LVRQLLSLAADIETANHEGTIAQFFNSEDNASSISQHLSDLDRIVNKLTLRKNDFHTKSFLICECVKSSSQPQTLTTKPRKQRLASETSRENSRSSRPPYQLRDVQALISAIGSPHGRFKRLCGPSIGNEGVW